MLVSTMPVPAVVVAAVDVIVVMTIALASARFLGDRSQGRIVSVPKELFCQFCQYCMGKTGPRVVNLHTFTHSPPFGPQNYSVLYGQDRSSSSK
jgi:hypothetical protein